jgi:hypothetical protein
MGQLIAKILIELATAKEVDPFEDEEQILLAPLAIICNRYKLLGRTLRELWGR